jgi:PXPV repeat (3 copies)
MSEEHTDNLKKARARLIEQRRAFVKVLAGPYERGKTEQARERFFEMQIAIADDNASNKGHCDGVIASGPRYYQPAPVYVAPAPVYIAPECYWTRGAPVWDGYRGIWYRPRIQVCD